MSIIHQAVRTKSFQSLPIDAPTPLRSGSADFLRRQRVPGIRLFAGRGRRAPRPGEQGREEALRAPHIQKRHLYLPEKDALTGRARPESAADLHTKFREGALEIGSRAIRSALDAASLSEADVDYILCVTSTGFMVPGLSSLFTRELGFDRGFKRADVVGMGCNAGLNGLNPLVQWVGTTRGRGALGLL